MNEPGNTGPLRLDRSDIVLRVSALEKSYALPSGRQAQAVSGVSFDIAAGETFGLVGESGCGKTTIGRSVIQLPPPTAGQVVFDGVDLTALPSTELRRARPRFQMVFQDPISSLNPQRRIGDIVSTPLAIAGHRPGPARDAAVRTMLEAVGLDGAAVWNRRPHELSGGQCQRVAMARALITRPKLLICDEPVSSLDVSVQAQILNLIADLKAQFSIAILFVAHDLAVVKNVSDRVGIMYLGRLCEIGESELVYDHPSHPYTAALLDAVPEPVPQARRRNVDAVRADPPSPLDPPSGCRFRLACPRADRLCAAEVPAMRRLEGDHQVACHHPLR